MYKILIRPLEKEDAMKSWKWRNDSEIWEFTGSRPNITITPEIEIVWIEKILLDLNSKRFAITVDDIYVGNVQLTNITIFDAEYHIFIGEKSCWGKGIAFSATQQIIRFAKNSLMLENIYLKVNPENLKAIRLYEKSGFEVVSDEVKMVLSIERNIKPMVSIFCMVYNHEPFIRQCLEGFLMQKCNFDYEIVLGEDCSTDNSREIILEYANKFPGKFKLLLHDKNIGASQNQKIVFENCTGKYIALCEGDDYWTDPLKLQKQVDFLDKQKEVVCLMHNAVLINNGRLEKQRKYTNNNMLNYITTEELFKGNSFPTCSLFFRNILLAKDFNILAKFSVGDWPLLLILSRKGKIYFENSTMATYRIHDMGEYSKLNYISKFELNQLLRVQIHKYFDCNKYERKLIIKSKREAFISFILQELRTKNIITILEATRIYLKTNKLL